jgi:hypothetical protein
LILLRRRTAWCYVSARPAAARWRSEELPCLVSKSRSPLIAESVAPVVSVPPPFSFGLVAAGPLWGPCLGRPGWGPFGPCWRCRAVPAAGPLWGPCLGRALLGPFGPCSRCRVGLGRGPVGCVFSVWASADMSGWQLSFSGLKVQTRLGTHKGLGDTGAGAHGHGSCPPLPKPNISVKQGSSPIIGGDRHITS